MAFLRMEIEDLAASTDCDSHSKTVSDRGIAFCTACTFRASSRSDDPMSEASCAESRAQVIFNLVYVPRAAIADWNIAHRILGIISQLIYTLFLPVSARYKSLP